SLLPLPPQDAPLPRERRDELRLPHAITDPQISSSPGDPASSPPPLTIAQLAALEARHIAFLEARLVSARSAEEWRRNATAVFAGLLASKLSDVIDARAV